jgi:hypothetical protein
VLDSSAATPAAPAAAPAGPAAAPPALTVTGQTRVSYDLRVDGATQPFWLVLGQSLNDGWHARVNGADLGPPTLVDGYANGWRITPASSGPFVITLEWTPQRLVWVALGISALAVIACLVLVVGDRRRVPPPPPEENPSPGRGRPSTLVVGALATGAAVTFGVLAGPLPGIVAGLAAVAGLVLPRRLRGLLGLLPGALLALAAAYIVAKSLRYPIPADLDWPAAFAATDILAWSAVAVTVTLVAVQAVRDRSP